MRRRFIWSDEQKCLVEIDVNAQTRQRAPLIMPDLSEYVSPVSGLVISGRRARREDLKRAGCRPYEGFEQERKEADRRMAYDGQRRDAKLEHTARTMYHQKLTPSQRRMIEGR